MKKNAVKIILDIIMLALLLMMYDAKALGQSFHEIGGIALLGLFIVHKALNFRWIASSGRKLFSKALPGRARLKFIIDALMFISVALVALSGILISEVVFRGAQGGGIWKTAHYFASAVALVLLGAHIGLNWAFVKNTIRLPRAVALPLGVILLTTILAFGGYSLVTSNFAGWLASPFTASAEIRGFPGADGLGLQRGDGGVTIPENTELPDSQLAPGSGEAFGQRGGSDQGFGPGGFGRRAPNCRHVRLHNGSVRRSNGGAG